MDACKTFLKAIGYAIALIGVAPLLPMIGLMWIIASLEKAEETMTTTLKQPAKPKQQKTTLEPSSIFSLSQFDSFNPA